MLKLGDNVNISDSSIDCPTMQGIIIDCLSCEEFEIMYHDGVEYTFGLFYSSDLTKSETQWNSHN
jgi:hypothetical protein